MGSGYYKRLTTEELFHKKVKKSKDGCWIWTAGSIRGGYGAFFSKGKNILAHRYAYELYREKIPSGMFVCHKCDNPPCVNPEHLFLGTNLDNFQDMVKKGRASFVNEHRIVRGEENGLSKLKENQVRKIKQLSATHSQSALSKMFNCHQTNIHYILSGKTWSHVK